MAATLPEQLILWAEDNEDDAFLFQRAFRQAKIDCTVVRVNDGGQAIEYLSGQGEYSDRSKHPLPQLLLLDVKMPKRDGFDVLNWRKSHPECQNIPAVMLSSSVDETDRARAHHLGAAEYLGKPSQPSEMVRVIRLVLSLAGKSGPALR